ncbi:hypothetical protein UA08_06868 [Talaromyces atroroseus]|uniref:Uncharacterized protein n=1 Tax=Talaromyces atroroseus TaxID=1441469 RepID=A0A225AXG1_TALAT|nr:hypothetical protein UA08_06868 [Talaromyces atroroseus]OKL58187.1 hypothetical protein UA08_06868 [Talaromyces atroroseus]
MDASCPQAADNSFGPAISCPRVFDFTLVFEQSILSIGPSALFLLLVPWRVWNLYGKSIKTSQIANAVLWFKLAIALTLTGIQIATLILWVQNNTIRTAIPAVALSVLDVLFITVLSFIEHSRSVRPSSLLSVYLLLSILFDCVQHKGKYLNPAHREKHPPEELSGIFGRTVFSWLNALFVQGFRKLLTLDDLFPTDDGLNSEYLMNRLKVTWAKYKSNRPRSIIYATVSCLRWPIFRVVFPRLCLIGFSYAQTFFIERALNLLNQPETQSSRNDGYGLVGAAALIYGGIAISSVHYQHQLYRMITMFRGAFVALIYGHSMTLRDGQYDESAVITHMSTDVDMIARSLEQLNELWARVLEIAIGIWLLERQMGAICVAPVLVVLFCTSLQTYMATFMPARQKLWMGAIERRIGVISMTLKSMRSVKMLGLSDSLGTMLQDRRRRELDLSRQFRWLIVWLNVVASLPQMCASLVTFAAFVIRSQIDGSDPLSTAQAFTSLSIITLITSPALQLLASIPALTASNAAFDRVYKFLTCSAGDEGLNRTPIEDSNYFSAECDKNVDQIPISDNNMTCFNVGKNSSSASFTPSDQLILTVSEAHIRPTPSSQFCMQSINLAVKPGSITVLTGPIGSGKSTLLKAIMGEIPCEKGRITLHNNNGIAYCEQTPWFQNTTIRNNICGYSGLMHLEWYNEVIDACALKDDLDRMPSGDGSVVGSQGLTLSGGQKQRLALARALYSRKRLLILDDVLSAVDWQTEQIILNRVFGKEGICRRTGLTVLMTAHSRRHLSLADEVMVLNTKGYVVKQGSFEPTLLTDEATQLEQSGLPGSSDEGSSLREKKVTVPKLLTPEIVSDMSRQTGDIAVYSYYLRAIGWPLVLGASFIILVYTFSASFPQVWLDMFTDNNEIDPGLFIGIYILLAVAASASQGFMIWQIMINIVVKSGLALHKVLVHSVMNAPMQLFTEVDSGVILNLFSQDMTIVDAVLPTMAFGTILGSSYMALTIIPTLVVLYLTQKVYLRTSRQIRFLDLEAKSPLYTHFAETLTGLTTIRGFGWQANFLSDCLRRLDISQRPYYLLFCIQRWLNVVLDLLVAILAVILTALATSLRESTDSGKLGVSLTAIMAFNQSLQDLVSSWTAMETSLGAVSRTRSFELNTPSEHQSGEDLDPPSDWPSCGKVEVQSVSASYDGVTNVLENISFTIRAGETVGICGRTGSGKSTLLSMLLRLHEPKAGKIFIDNIDISTIPRNILRTRLITITQDHLPAIPGCSIRLNADPRGIAQDAEIMSAMEKVGLLALIQSRGGLDGEDLNTHPLSQGEQKLFALARALITKWTRDKGITHCRGILILDEFTAGTDEETERLMLDIIDEEFAGYTIIEITHQIGVARKRLNRILNLVSGQLDDVTSSSH